MDLKRKLSRLTSVGPGEGGASLGGGPVVNSAALPGRAAEASPADSGDARDGTSKLAPRDTAQVAQEPGVSSRGAAHPSAVGGPGAGASLSPAERDARLRELRARLSQLASGSALRLRREEKPPARKPSSESQVCQIPGGMRSTSYGQLHVCERRYQDDHCHGTAPVAACLSISALDVAGLALDPALAAVDPARLLFLDLETTGLAGGTGTLPFLVGLSRFEDGCLVVEQLFLREPGAEGPILGYVAERLREASAIVTFNGKSFDWPLLRTRSVLNRIRLPDVTLHLDLLHCSRRIFKFRLEEMRLGRLEREVLGFERVDDIDGSEIPGSYFAYLRRGEGALLTRVFDHNAHDLVALPAMLGHLGTRFRDVLIGGDARDHLGLAHVAARGEDHARALRFALAAAEDRNGRVAIEAFTLAGEIMLRRHEWAQAAEYFTRALSECGEKPSEQAAALCLRLAKLYEHHLENLEKALAYAEKTRPAVGAAAQEHRVARLLRRLGHEGTSFL